MKRAQTAINKLNRRKTIWQKKQDGFSKAFAPASISSDASNQRMSMAWRVQVWRCMAE